MAAFPRFLIPLGLLLSFSPVHAFEQEVSPHGARLRWRTPALTWRADVSLSSLSPDAEAAVTAGFQAWATPPCTSLRFAVTSDAPVVVRVVTEGWPFDASLVAHTNVDADPNSGEIRGATLLLNGTYRFSTTLPPPKDAVDLQSVVLHEVGHVLGLRHTGHRASVMYGGFKLGSPAQRNLQPDDVTAVCTLYPAPPADPSPRAVLLPSLIVLALLVVWSVRASEPRR
ncbi:MAG: matrixin family metalloprotease [Myxococcota bacterium]